MLKSRRKKGRQVSTNCTEAGTRDKGAKNNPTGNDTSNDQGRHRSKGERGVLLCDPGSE